MRDKDKPFAPLLRTASSKDAAWVHVALVNDDGIPVAKGACLLALTGRLEAPVQAAGWELMEGGLGI